VPWILLSVPIEWCSMKVSCRPVLLPILAWAIAVGGCSSRQIYQSAAGWRLNECQKILDDTERAQCMEEANKDYDTYSKEK
jgi:hypothetical protein